MVLVSKAIFFSTCDGMNSWSFCKFPSLVTLFEFCESYRVLDTGWPSGLELRGGVLRIL